MISDVEFDIVEIEELSGDRAHIYSVLLNGEEQNLFWTFFREIQATKPIEAEVLFSQIYSMGHETGCRRGFFKLYEGKPGDGVAAISVGEVRLYCLYFDNTAIFLGSGGIKPVGVRAYQELPELNAKVELMEKIAAKINQMIKDKELKVLDNGELLWNM